MDLLAQPEKIIAEAIRISRRFISDGKNVKKLEIRLVARTASGGKKEYFLKKSFAVK